LSWTSGRNRERSNITACRITAPLVISLFGMNGR
jgi:hypothetical protein